MSRLRQRVAQRLKESQTTYALLTTFQEVDMFEAQKTRQV
jgi:2-oxoglutarate dehydrogenase E2 component (dihydrolipoamide succinyltransferase)